MSFPRKKPWNRVNLPVYSIASRHEGRYNMNICTYVTAVSMQPKRFLVAVYHNTLTLDLVTREGAMVLQLLAEDQYRLVDLLGKHSGRLIDKLGRLRKRALVQEWNDFAVLNGSLAYLQLRVMQQLPCGDHEGFLCELVAYKNIREGQPLTLDYLREKKLVRM